MSDATFKGLADSKRASNKYKLNKYKSSSLSFPGAVNYYFPLVIQMIETPILLSKL